MRLLINHTVTVGRTSRAEREGVQPPVTDLMRTRTYNTHNRHNGHSALVTSHHQHVLRASVHPTTRHVNSPSRTPRARRHAPPRARRYTPVAAELDRFGPYQTDIHCTARPLRGSSRPSPNLPSPLQARDGPHASSAPCHTRIARPADPHHYPSRLSHTAHARSGLYPVRASRIHHVSLDSRRTCHPYTVRTLHGSSWHHVASA